MYPMDRRGFVTGSLAAAAAGMWSPADGPCRAEVSSGQGLQLGRFRFDVTPPLGHSCCGGWITPVTAVDDPLEAVGIVVLGAGKPLVLCAVDWTGISNGAHLEWRAALAEAAGTTADRVALHCVHQHNAPLACAEAERMVAEQGDSLPHILDLSFFRQCLQRGRAAVTQAVSESQPLTHVATSQGQVFQVASNRRVSRDESGRVKAMRGSACRDAELVSLPEGLIDPWLKTIAFFNGSRKLASCHYYATHPMSYYGDGRVSSDFAGLARKARQQEDAECVHIYFTGCAGNIAAGKYNDGSREARTVLTQRMLDGIRASERDLKPEPIGQVEWRTVEILPPPRATLDAANLEQQLGDKTNSVAVRNRSAYLLSWLRRLKREQPIVLSALRLNEAALLHLPGEPFVEYQLRAQQTLAKGWVATAGYGDCGPWYLPIKDEYPHGGYEVSVAFCDPHVDDLLTGGIRKLLG